MTDRPDVPFPDLDSPVKWVVFVACMLAVMAASPFWLLDDMMKIGLPRD